MFEIVSYLDKIGVTEDGEDYIAEMYFIRAELKDGSRYAHFCTFPGAEVIHTDEGPYFPDIREKSMKEAEFLLGRIEAELGESIKVHGADCLDPDYWTEVAPAYGSKAYIDLDMESTYAELERRAG